MLVGNKQVPRPWLPLGDRWTYGRFQVGIVVVDHDYDRVAAWCIAPFRRVAAAYGVAYIRYMLHK